MVLETKNSPRGGKKMGYGKLLDFKDFLPVKLDDLRLPVQKSSTSFASVRDAAGTLPGSRRAANRMEVTWINCATSYNPASRGVFVPLEVGECSTHAFHHHVSDSRQHNTSLLEYQATFNGNLTGNCFDTFILFFAPTRNVTCFGPIGAGSVGLDHDLSTGK